MLIQLFKLGQIEEFYTLAISLVPTKYVGVLDRRNTCILY